MDLGRRFVQAECVGGIRQSSESYLPSDGLTGYCCPATPPVATDPTGEVMPIRLPLNASSKANPPFRRGS
jgi:hypothetical protein